MQDKYDSTAAYAEHLDLLDRIDELKVLLAEQAKEIADLQYRVNMTEAIGAEIVEIKARIR